MKHPPKLSPFGLGRTRYAAVLCVTGLAGAGAALANVAAARPSPTLGIATNVQVKSHLDSVVVTSHGISVYTLSGESTHHLQCTKANTCFKFWFPVTVASAHAKLSSGSGVSGKLGRLHREGIFQVTLGGRPLYTFIGDGARRRSATGEGIVSFGGTWHVIAERTRSLNTTATVSTTATNSQTSSTSGSSYP